MLFRRIHASRIFAQKLNEEAKNARSKWELKSAFEAAEEATRRFLNHKTMDKLYYYVYKWLVTDFCTKYGFSIRKLIKRTSAIKRCWLRPSVNVAQSTTSA